MKSISVSIVLLLVSMYAILLFAAQPSGEIRGAEAQAQRPLTSENSGMQIRLTIAGRSLSATLVDSPTARDFVSLLPLTLELEDYAGTEKIVYLSRKLTEEGAPSGVDPSVGDITYYAPWGNLALFYKDFGYAKGLIKLGSLDEGLEEFDVPGSVKVTIEIAKP